MSHPPESSSPGNDSDSGFDFVPPTKRASLPTPKPGKPTAANRAPSPAAKAAARKSRRAKEPLPQASIQIQTGDATEQTITDRLRRKRSQLSSVFTSTALHTVVFLVLGLWALEQKPQPVAIGLVAALDVAKETETKAIELSPIKFETPEVADSPLDNVAEDTSSDVEEAAANEVPTLVTALPSETVAADSTEPVAVAPARTLPTGGGLAGREANNRANLAAQFGGSPDSEAAVELGLQWIIKHQLTDGSWRFRHHSSACNGRCGNEGRIDSPNAATGLALMSLLGAGYTHQRGPYQAEIQLGLDYLDREIRYLPYGGSLKGIGSKALYSHAIATIALAEALAMTGDETYRKPVVEAYRFIVASQHAKGGWKYRDRSPGDMSVTGWMVMAMKACENAGVEPDEKSRRLAREFVDSLAFAGGVEYGYEMSGKGDIKPAAQDRKPSCSAIGQLMKMYFGRHREHPDLANACQFLAETGSSDSDIYFNFYGTLVLHHARAPQWKQWNQTVRDHLIQTQRRNGHEAGSWFFSDLHGNTGGRLYTTAMAIMTLEVYYRFMPLYQIEASDNADFGT